MANYSRLFCAFYLCLVAALALLSVQGAPRASRRSRELNDKSFEHDTQATTGSTTGDWFVKFCTKQSKECLAIEPLWDEVAENLMGRVTVAHIDLQKTQELNQRFSSILNYQPASGNSYQPKLLFLKRRKYYQYTGSLDDVEALTNFALENYENAEVKGDIPAEAGAMMSLWRQLLDFVETSGAALNKFLIADEKTGDVNYMGIGMFFGVPLVMILSLCCVILAQKEEEHAVGSKQAPSNPQASKLAAQRRKDKLN